LKNSKNGEWTCIRDLVKNYALKENFNAIGDFIKYMSEEDEVENAAKLVAIVVGLADKDVDEQQYVNIVSLIKRLSLEDLLDFAENIIEEMDQMDLKEEENLKVVNRLLISAAHRTRALRGIIRGSFPKDILVKINSYDSTDNNIDKELVYNGQKFDNLYKKLVDLINKVREYEPSSESSYGDSEGEQEEGEE
jgi:hypothetical protein